MTEEQRVVWVQIVGTLRSLGPAMVYIARPGYAMDSGFTFPWPGYDDPGQGAALTQLAGVMAGLTRVMFLYVVPEGMEWRRGARFPWPATPLVPFGDPEPMATRKAEEYREAQEEGPKTLLGVKEGRDTCKVTWPGTGSFVLSKVQAVVAQELAEAFLWGRPEVEQGVLLRKAGAKVRRLEELFRGCAAWGTLIVRGEGPGCFRLPPPPEEEAA